MKDGAALYSCSKTGDRGRMPPLAVVVKDFRLLALFGVFLALPTERFFFGVPVPAALGLAPGVELASDALLEEVERFLGVGVLPGREKARPINALDMSVD